ncbi:MAG: hypothetical protein JKY30_11305 [Flavobacteriales bacterium]|nr:hypothetical protein [Flavobacteriales bacterium]
MKFLTQISSIIVALLFVYTINFKSFVTISYFVNQAEIIELFCINKEKPQLQCDGKCHLANQLAEVENDTEESPFSPNNISYNLEINLSLTETEIDIQPPIKSLTKQTYYIFNSPISEGFHSIQSPPPKS